MFGRRRYRRLETSLLVLACVAVTAAADVSSVIILHTNDIHGHLAGTDEYAGLARIASYIKAARHEDTNVIALDAGDCISGTPVSALSRGVSVYEAMVSVGYDAAVLGNHEFDHGWHMIETFREIAPFPILSANAVAPNGNLVADAAYIVQIVGGVRVGIVGISHSATTRLTVRKGNEGLSFIDEVEVLKNVVPRVREDCDLLVVLSHAGIQRDIDIARSVEDIDLIVGGHDHVLLEGPLRIGDTRIVQAGAYGRYIGRVRVDVDLAEHRVTEVTAEVIPAADLPSPDPAVQALVRGRLEQVSDALDQRIAFLPQVVDGNELRALVEQAVREASGADIGYYNRGGIRDVLREGPVTIRDVWSVEPFGNTIARVVIRGDRIAGYLHEDLNARGVELDPDRTYAIATNSYIAEQAGRYLGEGPMEVVDTGRLVRDAIIEHLRRHYAAPEARGR